jgi:hypothetical protein
VVDSAVARGVNVDPPVRDASAHLAVVRVVVTPSLGAQPDPDKAGVADWLAALRRRAFDGPFLVAYEGTSGEVSQFVAADLESIGRQCIGVAPRSGAGR